MEDGSDMINDEENIKLLKKIDECILKNDTSDKSVINATSYIFLFTLMRNCKSRQKFREIAVELIDVFIKEFIDKSAYYDKDGSKDQV